MSDIAWQIDIVALEGTKRVSIRNKIFREVCANMLIHREFSSAFPAKLIIEKGRVRTENANIPHGFGEINSEDFSPFSKNPAISKFFREIGLADELVSGIRNINKYLKEYSGSKLEFIEGDVFELNIPLGVKKKNEPQTRMDKLLDLIYEKPSINKTEMANILGVSSSTVKRIISKLIEEGKLDYEGSSKREYGL